MDLNSYAKQMHAQNVDVGWWDDPNRCIFECLQLVSTEIAEATEGERKNLMDDHLPHRRMGEVELADALIRTLDLGAHLGFKFPVADMAAVQGQGSTVSNRSVGKRHLALNAAVIQVADALDQKPLAASVEDGEEAANALALAILVVAASFGYDIEGAMVEKLEYNKTRADHKRENRTGKPGEKAF